MKSNLLQRLGLLVALFAFALVASAAPETLSPSKKQVRIVVMGQEDFHPDRTVPGNVRSLPDDLAARVIEQLTKTKRFEVLERTALRRVVREQQFGQKAGKTDLDRVIEKTVENLPETNGWTIAAASVAADHNDRLKEFKDLGTALGADYILYAVLEQQKASTKQTAVPFSDRGRTQTEKQVDARLRLRLIDARQGRIVGADSLRTRISETVFKGREPSQDAYSMFDHLGRQAALSVLDMVFPPRLVGKDPWIVDRGSDQGVQVGDRYRVEREGKAVTDATGVSLGRLRTPVGHVRVTRVQPAFSVVEPVDGKPQLNDLALPQKQAVGSGGRLATAPPLVRTAGAAAAPPVKPRLAVGLVKAGSTARTGANANEHIPAFTDTLISRLAQTRRFQLIDRQETDQLLDEQLAQAMAENRALPSVMGQLKGADYLLIGSVSNFAIDKTATKLPGSSRVLVGTKGRVEGNMRVVDARTGDVLASRKISVAESLSEPAGEAQLVTALADAYADQVTVELMNAIYPIKVAAVVSGVAYINRGSDGGLQAGERLRAVRPGQPIIDPDTGVQMGNAEQELGEVVLAEVEDARSKAPVGDVVLQRGDILKRMPERKGRRATQAARMAAPARTGGRADSKEGGPMTLAVGMIKVNPRANNRRLRNANPVRITNDLMVKLSQFPEFDVMERSEIDQVLDEKTFTAIAAGNSPTDSLRELQGADYLVHAAIDDFLVRLEQTRVPYTNELQNRYFGTAEATLRMVDAHTGKLVSAVKLRIDDRLKQTKSDGMATNDLIDRLTTEMATRISDDLLARREGTLVPIGRRPRDTQDERPAPAPVRRPNF